jgi:hypothetical protein
VVPSALGPRYTKTLEHWGSSRDHSATLLRVFPYAAINFSVYDEARNVRLNAFVLLAYPLTHSQLLIPTRAQEKNLR